MILAIKLVCGVLACLICVEHTRRGDTIGDLTPDRFLAISVLMIIAWSL